MLKKDELVGPSCLTRAHDDEPIFVLRANDDIAPGLIRLWAIRYQLKKQKAGTYGEREEAKYHEALNLAKAMEEWVKAKHQICEAYKVETFGEVAEAITPSNTK